MTEKIGAINYITQMQLANFIFIFYTHLRLMTTTKIIYIRLRIIVSRINQLINVYYIKSV